MTHPDSLTARFARFSWSRFVRHIPAGGLGAAKERALARLKRGAKREEECDLCDASRNLVIVVVLGVLWIIFVSALNL